MIVVIQKKLKFSSSAGQILISVLIGFLILVAGKSFFEIWPGLWAVSIFTGVLGYFGWPVAAVAVILTLLAMIVIFADVKDKKVDGPARTALFLLPGLVLLFGGPLAQLWGSIYEGAKALAMNGLSGIGG